MPPISTLESLLAPGETALAPGGTVIADDATGSELQRRGVLTPLPPWSTAALLTPAGQQTLQAIHADYLQAGAQFLTANTFRTHARNLRAAGLQDQAAELTRLAVQIAREAIEVTRCSGAFVAGSHAPLEDCYSPELTPPDAELRREHAHHVEHLAAAGVDFILIETMPTIREAVAAAEAAGCERAVRRFVRQPTAGRHPVRRVHRGSRPRRAAAGAQVAGHQLRVGRT